MAASELDRVPIRTRLFIPAPLTAGGPVGLDPTQAHYLRHVLRLRPGERVAVFNGEAGEWLATIDGLGKGWGSLTVQSLRRPQTQASALTLLFAPVKRSRLDYLVEKATELGVSHLVPVMTERTVPDRVNLDRLRANAVEAAEQCERLEVPALSEPVPLLRGLADWPAERPLFLCAEAGACTPALTAFGRRRGEPAAILTGPEGGFTETELDRLHGLPFVEPVGLGPRILRSETAALVALALWQAAAGDGTDGPRT